MGIDLCGDPARGGVEALSPVFLEARRTVPGLGVTLHFAEAEASGTDEELMLLLSWRPDRIGHVIHVSDRVREAIVARRGMGLELCLSCNVHAGMICGGFEEQYVVTLSCRGSCRKGGWLICCSCDSHFGEWWRVEDAVVVLSVSFFVFFFLFFSSWSFLPCLHSCDFLFILEPRFPFPGTPG